LPERPVARLTGKEILNEILESGDLEGALEFVLSQGEVCSVKPIESDDESDDGSDVPGWMKEDEETGAKKPLDPEEFTDTQPSLRSFNLSDEQEGNEERENSGKLASFKSKEGIGVEIPADRVAQEAVAQPEKTGDTHEIFAQSESLIFNDDGKIREEPAEEIIAKSGQTANADTLDAILNEAELISLQNLSDSELRKALTELRIEMEDEPSKDRKAAIKRKFDLVFGKLNKSSREKTENAFVVNANELVHGGWRKAFMSPNHDSPSVIITAEHELRPKRDFTLPPVEEDLEMNLREAIATSRTGLEKAIKFQSTPEEHRSDQEEEETDKVAEIEKELDILYASLSFLDDLDNETPSSPLSKNQQKIRVRAKQNLRNKIKLLEDKLAARKLDLPEDTMLIDMDMDVNGAAEKRESQRSPAEIKRLVLVAASLLLSGISIAVITMVIYMILTKDDTKIAEFEVPDVPPAERIAEITEEARRRTLDLIGPERRKKTDVLTEIPKEIPVAITAMPADDSGTKYWAVRITDNAFDGTIIGGEAYALDFMDIKVTWGEDVNTYECELNHDDLKSYWSTPQSTRPDLTCSLYEPVKID